MRAHARCPGQRAGQLVLLGHHAHGMHPVLRQPATMHCAAGLPANLACVALFRFSIFLFNSNHCKFKYLYKFDLKSEKYEKNSLSRS
jgi:hypothetical protein